MKTILSVLVFMNVMLFADTFEVVKVTMGSDPDRYSMFELNDGSKWARLGYIGPIYFVEVGQMVEVIPLTHDEIEINKTYFVDFGSAFWIILNPSEENSEIGIGFIWYQPR